MIKPTREEIASCVKAALAEDIGSGDATSLAIFAEDLRVAGDLRTREPAVICGLELAGEVFRQVDPAMTVDVLLEDGDAVAKNCVIMTVTGSARSMLTAERTALNFLQWLSGIATLTARFVEAVRGTRARILDTRKTTPGWRRLEKYAVACGGGENHREGLFDMILIKDNHLAALRDAKPNPVAEAVRRSREKFPGFKVEVEADDMDQVQQAVEAGADIILLDNMIPATLREAARLVAGRVLTEASGGVELETVRAVAETGVDRISVGALTHSARAVDIAMEMRRAN